MAVVKETRDGRLRLGGVGGPFDVEGPAGSPTAGIRATIRRKPGVLEWRDIPAGLVVQAVLDWPVGLVPSGSDIADIDVGARAVAGLPAGTPLVYRFEHAAPADVTLPGGGTVPRTGKRFIIPSASAPFGPVTYIQEVPPYAAFSTPVGGTLYQKGRLEHTFQMPGYAAGEKQEWLRLRWVGTAVAAAVPQGPDGGVGFTFAATTITRNDGGDWTTEFVVGDYVIVSGAANPANDGVWGPITNVAVGVLTIASGGLTASVGDNTAVFTRDTSIATVVAATQAEDVVWGRRQDTDLVPGSIVLTLPTSGGTLRDDGRGRIVGTDGDGVVDYQSGAFRLRFYAPETGDIVAVYEHSCPYHPLDAHLSWDSLLQ